MTSKIAKPVTIAMSLLSLTIFIVLVILSTVKSVPPERTTTIPTIQSFKEYVTNMIKDQSSKIQVLLKKIQTNAQSVLKKIENLKQESKANKKELTADFRPQDLLKSGAYDGHQVETPILKNNLETIGTDAVAESRSFAGHYTPSSYGVSANANYGAVLTQTYHHHSIGFDPINIVVSMSLLSFLLQALQGLLSRTRLPTQVVEARYLNPVQDWLKQIEDKYVEPEKSEYLKRKYPKKYYR